jgi:hypothetical protein
MLAQKSRAPLNEVRSRPVLIALMSSSVNASFFSAVFVSPYQLQRPRLTCSNRILRGMLGWPRLSARLLIAAMKFGRVVILCDSE